jgi:hypothetical protein
MATSKGRRYLLILAPILGLVLAEVLLRVFERPPAAAPGNPFQICMTTHEGKRISPSEGGLHLTPAPYTIWMNRPNHETSAFRINSRGLRGPEIPARRPDRRRIMIVGASAVFGFLIQHDEGTISRQLEALLPSTDVLNAGVVMFQSGQELSWFVTELADFAPDVLVAYDGWGDSFEAVYGEDRGGAPLGFKMSAFLALEHLLSRAVEPEPDVGGLFGAMIRKSRVARALARAFGGTGAAEAPDAPAPPVIRAPRDGAGSAEAYAANILKLSDFCRSRGIGLLVALQPELGQKKTLAGPERRAFDEGFGESANYRSEFPPRYAVFRRGVMEKLRSAGVDAIDVGEQPEIASSEAPLFLDVVHTSPAGNAVVARILRDALASLEPK